MGHAVYERTGRRPRRGGLRGRRRLPGPRARHDPARAPRRGGRGAGRLGVRGRGAARRTTAWSRCSARAGSRSGRARSPDLAAGRVPDRAVRRRAERFEERERNAAAAARAPLPAAASVAVIGAVARARHRRRRDLPQPALARRSTAPSTRSTRSADVVQSVPAFASVARHPRRTSSWPSIACPPPLWSDVARQCAAKGVRALLVISAGFAETGGEGRAPPGGAARHLPRAGMRLVGPNCLGVLNTSPDVRLDAIFGPLFPPHGNVGFLSQSGALGLAVIDYASELGLGLSSFVSVGNKADISGNDLIQYWESDDETRRDPAVPGVVRQPAQVRAASRGASARTKPIVAVKSGRSAAGARATSSHTGRADLGLGRDGRLAVRAGRRDPHRHARTSCSTSPRCSPTSPCRAAAASRS